MRTRSALLALVLVLIPGLAHAAIRDAITLTNNTTLYGIIVNIGKGTAGATVTMDVDIADETGVRKERKTFQQAQIALIRLDGRVYPAAAMPANFSRDIPPPQPPAPKQPAAPVQPSYQSPAQPTYQQPVQPLPKKQPKPKRKVRQQPVRPIPQLQLPPQPIRHPEVLRREPAGALAAACLLPGGGAMYNGKKGQAVLHHLFQLGFPAVFMGISAAVKKPEPLYGAAAASLSISKLVDMYKSLFDAHGVNKELSVYEYKQ